MSTSESKNGEQKYTRAQLRQVEKLKEEADSLHRNLCGKFVHFFMNHDSPEGVEVLNKAKEVSAKWKMFCIREHIKPEFADSIEKFCEKYIEDYKKEKGEVKDPTAELNRRLLELQFQNLKLTDKLESVPMFVRRIFKAL